jgi:hypothetical protein
MFRFLTSRIGISLLIAVVVVASAVVFKHIGPKNSDLKAQVNLIAESSVKRAIESGALETPEWEKVLRELSGTTTIDEKVAILAQNASTSAENLTATDLFARAFLVKYVNLRKSGGTLDETTGLNLINSLLAQDYGSIIVQKTYTGSDIKNISANVPSALKSYGNSIVRILKAPVPDGYEQELDIISRVTDTQNLEDLEKLDINIERYRSVRDSLLTLTVPKALITPHVALVNSVNAILEGVEAMRNIEKDPVGATKMLARYEDGLKSIDLPLASIKQYLLSQNITFSPSESGYVLMR